MRNGMGDGGRKNNSKPHRSPERRWKWTPGMMWVDPTNIPNYPRLSQWGFQWIVLFWLFPLPTWIDTSRNTSIFTICLDVFLCWSLLNSAWFFGAKKVQIQEKEIGFEEEDFSGTCGDWSDDCWSSWDENLKLRDGLWFMLFLGFGHWDPCSHQQSSGANGIESTHERVSCQHEVMPFPKPRASTCYAATLDLGLAPLLEMLTDGVIVASSPPLDVLLLPPLASTNLEMMECLSVQHPERWSSPEITRWNKCV